MKIMIHHLKKNIKFKIQTLEVACKKQEAVLWKKAVLINFAKFTEKHLWIKKESLAQVFLCEFWKTGI